MPLPLVPLLLGSSVLLLFFGSKKAAASPAAPPRNATGDIPGRDEPPAKKEPTSVAEVLKAAEQAAEIVQRQSVEPVSRPADQIRQIAAELEQHLLINRPGTERPAMVAAFQTPRGLKPDGKYGPVTALDLARVLGRKPPPPRFGTAIALAKYKDDLAKLLGSAQSVSKALEPRTSSTIPWAPMADPADVRAERDRTVKGA